MKATKYFLALGLALMITGMDTIYSYSANTIGGNGSTNTPQEITFVVNILPPDNLAGLNCRYWVALTNDRGAVVGKAQPFRLGQWTYTFNETGIVSGSITARMVTDPQLSCLGAYYIPPSTLIGPFGPGRTYTFTLTPQKAPTSVVNGIH